MDSEIITSIALVITAITGFISVFRSLKVERKVDKVQRTGDENHKMLNSESKARMDYQRALIRALEEKGISVPIDQSIPDAKPIGN